MDGDVFRGGLLPSEQLIWSGQRRQGVLFTSRDICRIPFSLVWCSFAIFGTLMAGSAAVATGRAKATWFPLFGLAFVCLELYFVVGRFVFDAWIRRGVCYALTDRRVLIARCGPFADFKAISVDRLPHARLSTRRSGRGDSRCGEPVPLWSGRGHATWSPALAPTPQFPAIEEARRIFNLVQRGASQSS